MRQPFSYVSVSEAWDKMAKAGVELLESERVSTREALGRILAENVVSQTRIPRDYITHYDGYAIRSLDTSNAGVNPVLLKVVGKIYPGERARSGIQEGEAFYVATGAPLPDGSDAVLALEMARPVGNDRIEVRAEVRLGEHVIRAGADVEIGDIVLPKGKTLSSQDIALLALLKIESIEVLKKPVVSILSIGDELVDKMSPHSFLLSRWIEFHGGVPIDLGIARDNINDIRNKLLEALKADVVLTIGACSMGEKDLMADAIKSAAEPRLIFHGVKIKPGRVSGFGMLSGKPIVMLPGLIQSTIVGFHFLVLPLLQSIRGLPLSSAWNTVTAKLAESLDFRKFTPFKKATFVKVEQTSDGLVAHPIRGDSSFFTTVTKANGIVMAQENVTHIEKDEIVVVHMLPN